MRSSSQGNGRGDANRNAVLARGSGSAWQPSRQRNKKSHKPNRDKTKDPAFVESVVLARYVSPGPGGSRSIRSVAREVGASEVAVSAALKVAEERGMIRTIVMLPSEAVEVYRLERRVKEIFGLREVFVVPSLPTPPGSSSRDRNGGRSQLRFALAERAARYLNDFLTAHADDPEDMLIGCAWGHTLYEVALCLECAPNVVNLPRARVRPIVGGTMVALSHDVEANVIASRIARAIGGKSEQLPCPAVLEALDADIVLRSPPIREVLDEIKKCRIVITGMGPALDDPDGDSENTLINNPKMNQRLIEAARAGGAIGEISCSFFDDCGAEVRPSTLTIAGLGYPGLKKTSADPNRRVVLVTGGDWKRFRPLKVALKAGLASVLVTDTVTARYLVGELEEPEAK